MNATTTAATDHAALASRLIKAITRLADRGWTPATSSNFYAVHAFQLSENAACRKGLSEWPHRRQNRV